MNNKKILILTNECFDDVIKQTLKILLDADIKTIHTYKDDLDGYIQGLNEGYNILLNIGDIEEFDKQCDILKKLNYKFESYTLKNYKILKKVNPKIKIYNYMKYKFLLKLIIKLENNIQTYIRKNIGFEIKDGSFSRIKKYIEKDIYKKYNIYTILKKYRYYKLRLTNIPVDKPKNYLKVGIVSNDYIPVKQYYDFSIEKILANKNIETTRYMNNYNYNKINYLYYRLNTKKVCKYKIDNNIIKNLFFIKKFINKNYDGIIYIVRNNSIKDNISSIMAKNMCNKNDIPIIFIKMNNELDENNLKINLETFSYMVSTQKNINKML